MDTPKQPIKLYGYPLSGHAHRVELLLRSLQLPYLNVHIDLRLGEHKRPEFLAMHPFGQVPVLDDNGLVMWDSAAIMVYLATRYDEGRWLPKDASGAGEVQRWLSVAAGPLLNSAGAARRLNIFQRSGDIEGAQKAAHRLLEVIDAYLQHHEHLAADRLTIADLANYSYIAHAPEGGVDLSHYLHVQAWLRRVEAMPGFVGMPVTKVGLWAE